MRVDVGVWQRVRPTFAANCDADDNGISGTQRGGGDGAIEAVGCTVQYFTERPDAECDVASVASVAIQSRYEYVSAIELCRHGPGRCRRLQSDEQCGIQKLASDSDSECHFGGAAGSGYADSQRSSKSPENVFDRAIPPIFADCDAVTVTQFVDTWLCPKIGMFPNPTTSLSCLPEQNRGFAEYEYIAVFDRARHAGQPFVVVLRAVGAAEVHHCPAVIGPLQTTVRPRD